MYLTVFVRPLLIYYKTFPVLLDRQTEVFAFWRMSRDTATWKRDKKINIKLLLPDDTLHR